MSGTLEPLTGIVTTDLAAVTRGRFVATTDIDATAATGVGWIQSNLSLTAFGGLSNPNIWKSSGDLRLIPDFGARFLTHATGGDIPFDMVIGDLVEIDGSPWAACPRNALRQAAAALETETGLRLKVSFEQEFYLLRPEEAPDHPLAFSALRRSGAFAPQLVAGLREAGLRPENILAELGPGQLEISIAPSAPIPAADQAVAVREIARELAHNLGQRASFAPKPYAGHSGSGVHIHFSLTDSEGHALTYDADGPAGLSPEATRFCAGILRHLPALTAFTASSPASFERLKPYSWSASYTWLADQDREATLRVCPVLAMKSAPADQLNIEFRAADATANPYLALAALIRAGLEGLRNSYELPPLASANPEELSEAERQYHGLTRLPTSLSQALAQLEADATVGEWFPRPLFDTFLAVKRTEAEIGEGFDKDDLLETYRALY